MGAQILDDTKGGMRHPKDPCLFLLQDTCPVLDRYYYLLSLVLYCKGIIIFCKTLATMHS